MIESAIYSLLSTNAGLTALVGAKIFPVITTEGTTAPFVVYSVKTKPSYTHDGRGDDTTTLEVLAYAKKYIDACSIINAVRAAIELKSGTWAGTTINELTIDEITDDIYIDTADTLFIKTLTATIIHN